MTGDRVLATIAALIALAGVILGGLALARAGRGSAAALATGMIGLLVGGFVVVTADGGPGTGNGIVGGYAALVLGLAGTILGAVSRARRPAVRDAGTARLRVWPGPRPRPGGRER